MQQRDSQRERELMWMSEREGACRRNVKTFFDHEASYFTLTLAFTSETYTADC